MVRALEPNTRVILMTAYGSEKVEREAQRLNVYRYVSKPFRTEDMNQWAKDALRDFEQAGPRLPRTNKGPAESQPKPSPEAGELLRPTPGQSSAAHVAKKAAPDAAPPENDRLSPYLIRLRYLLGAQVVLLANMKGQTLASAGALRGLDGARFASLIASGFQAALAAGAVLGAGEVTAGASATDSGATMIMQGGQRYSACSVRVGDDGVLVILFERAAQALYRNLWPGPIRRAVEELQSLAAEPTSGPATPGADSRGGLREHLYGSFPAQTEDVAPKHAAKTLRNEPAAPALRERVSETAALDDEMTEDAGDFATLSEQGISIEDARAMGIISDDVLSRLIGEEDDKQ